MTQSRKDQSLKPKKNSESIVTKPKGHAYPIVAMGGSAGSFQAFEKFFLHMPADSGMSFAELDLPNQGTRRLKLSAKPIINKINNQTSAILIVIEM